MPTYEFLCQACGLLFDASAPIAKRNEPKLCVSCGQPAPPVPPSTVQGHFRKEVAGPGPQNTGIHDLDTHIDRVIGQHAQQGWEVVRGRQQLKREVLESNPQATGHDLSKNPDGSYRVMKPQERGVHDRTQAIQRAYGAWRKKGG